MYYEFKGINAFLIGMSNELLQHGVKRITRSYTCYELPHPVMIKITQPTARLVTVEERGWNRTLPFAESLWLARGQNNINMVGHYLKNLFDYSDDKQYMRAGYGPRLRFFNGLANDYKIAGGQVRMPLQELTLSEVDQFEFVVRSFQRDPFTRQAVIVIGDPSKDCFAAPGELKATLDFPCTKSIHFQRAGNSLDMVVHMRSNDFVFGASGVNIFNFTFIQEYMAQILSLEVGSYYHVVDNFHYYEKFQHLLAKLTNVKHVEDYGFVSSKSFSTLPEFDARVAKLAAWEEQWRNRTSSDLPDFGDDFFDDWAKVLYLKNVQPSQLIRFANPALQHLHERSLLNQRSAMLSKQVKEIVEPSKKNIKQNKTRI